MEIPEPESELIHEKSGTVPLKGTRNSGIKSIAYGESHNGVFCRISRQWSEGKNISIF
ncbi:MAG: hypothetical protein LBS77_01710 [Desulfovibrio sp.]|jgi:hypothetical protein|nr:hypothetical protein [Desulfovibrio sp.]